MVSQTPDLAASVQLTAGLPLPQPAAGQLLVRVTAAAVNPVDWKIVLGYIPSFLIKPPASLGFDFCGTVVAAHRTRRLKPGDRVFGMPLYRATGSFAEYLLVSEDYAALAPANLSDAEAASIPLAGQTSLQALRAGRLAGPPSGHQPGPRVLVLGGASGTGFMGVQLAKVFGASHVAVTCSAAKAEFCRGFGADRVVDYRSEDWTRVLEGEQYDLIYDCVGGEESWRAAADDKRRILRPNGYFVTIAGDKQEPLTAGKLLSVGASIFGRKFLSLLPNNPSYSFITCESNHHDLEELARLAEAGLLRPYVERVYSLGDIVAALQFSQTATATGKIAINCQDLGTSQVVASTEPSSSTTPTTHADHSESN